MMRSIRCLSSTVIALQEQPHLSNIKPDARGKAGFRSCLRRHARKQTQVAQNHTEGDQFYWPKFPGQSKTRARKNADDAAARVVNRMIGHFVDPESPHYFSA